MYTGYNCSIGNILSYSGQQLRFYCLHCETAVCSSCTDIEHRFTTACLSLYRCHPLHAQPQLLVEKMNAGFEIRKHLENCKYLESKRIQVLKTFGKLQIPGK